MKFFNKYYLSTKIKEVKKEIKTITWAPKKEISQTILIVIILVSLVSIFLWIIDSILMYFVSKIL
jgi:preprotein translocase SecE subunit